MLFLLLCLATSHAGDVVDFKSQTARSGSVDRAEVDIDRIYTQLDRIAEQMERLENLAIEVRETTIRRAFFEELRALNREMLLLERQIEAAAGSQQQAPEPAPPPAEPEPEPEPVWDRGACETTLTGHFAKSLSQARAYDEAREACAKPFDMAVYDYLYPLFAASTSSMRAAEDSVEMARKPGVGERLDVIQWAAPRFAKSTSSSRAAEDAVEETVGLTSDDVPCLDRAYGAYSQSFSSSMATEKAIESCKE